MRSPKQILQEIRFKVLPRTHVRLLITKCVGYPTQEFVGYLRGTWRQRTLDLRAITDLSGRKIRVMTDKSVIAYPSIWPFARCTIFNWDMFPANTMAYDTLHADTQ